MIVSINFDLFYQEVIIHSIIPNLVVMLIATSISSLK